jgi:signal peptidase II
VPERVTLPPEADPRVRRLRRFVLVVVALAALIAADVATKTWAEHHLRRVGSRSVLGDWLVLRYQTNSGIAFGVWRAPMIPWKRSFLITYSAVVTLGLAGLLGRRLWDRDTRMLGTVGVGALLAGSAGNLRDRVMRGAVIDFIDLQPPGTTWPAFNLADLYLATGLGLCITSLVLAHRRQARAEEVR